MHDLRWSNVPYNRRVQVTAWCPCGWTSKTEEQGNSYDVRPDMERAFLQHLQDAHQRNRGDTPDAD